MWRDCLALIVAFSVTVFGLSPQLSAQQQQYPLNQDDPNAAYGQPAEQQDPQAGQLPASSQEPPLPPQGGEGDAIDPAASAQHGVARLSVVQGDVNIKRADSGELVAAAINAPVVGGDRVQTAAGSRAEVELDSANVVRVGPNTDLGFATLQRHRFQLQLGAGAVIGRVIRSDASTLEIDTPSVGVHPTAQGVYRIGVGDDGTTRIAVRIGSAEVYSPRGTEQLSAGQTMAVRGDPSNPEFLPGTAVEQDVFEDWSINRDRTLLQSQSYQHVSPDIEGAEDLDANGTWVPSQYGQVWAPRPPSQDWSPYSDGHWAYVDDYYGWSWVGSEPWGWAPYHYGRWFWNGGYGWSWWPGQAGAGVYWSPALVGFFGFGAGVLGGIGWAALAPFETCHPWWGHGYGFGNRYGFDRGRFGFGGGFRGNVAGLYRNAGFRGGALTAGYGQFGSHFGRFSAASREQLAGASAFRGAIPVRPAQAGYRFANRQAVGNSHLNGAAGRSFFQRQGATNGGGFARGAQQTFGSAGRGNGNGGFGGGARPMPAQQTQHGIAPNLSGRGRGGASQTAPSMASGGGWQHFGNAGGSTSRQSFSSGAPAQQGGWHAFGRPETSSRPAYGGGSYSNSPYTSGRPQYGTPNRTTPQQPQRYGGAYSGQSYGRGGPSYSQPRAAPNYGSAYRGGSAPAPHYNSQPSFGGSRGGSASPPHYGGSSGGGSYHGGGGGGGGHPSGGGGGGGHSGGGGGGHHR